MDIEKLIEQLRDKGCEDCPHRDTCRDDDTAECVIRLNAATALSTFQDENAEMQKQLNEFSEFLCRMTGGLLSKTNYTAQEMISAAEDYQQKVCGECDLRAENEKLRVELEQVTRDFDGICKYIDSEGFLRKQFCENGNSDLGPCICPSLQEHPGYIDSDVCEGCDYFCNSWRSQKED